MRCTLTLDDHVAALLRRVQKKRKLPLKALVNEALWAGLHAMDAQPARRTAYHITPWDLGDCRLSDIDNVAQVLSVIEGDDET